MPTTPDLVKSLYERWSAAFAAEPEMPLDRWRELIEEWPQITAEPGGVDYVEVDAGGVPNMWITPKGAAEDRVILSIHGGGFVVGSMYTHRKLFGHIAKVAGVRALAPDYRRPPEHLHPAPVEDVVATYKWLLDQGIEPSRVAFTGDSSGGALVVTAMLLARDRGLPLPAAGMPFSAGSTSPGAANRSGRTPTPTSCSTSSSATSWPTSSWASPATGATRTSAPCTPTSPAYRRCTSRCPTPRPSSTTAERLPSARERPASRCASTSSPASSTRSRWPPAGRPSPTRRSAAWPTGSGPIWACERRRAKWTGLAGEAVDSDDDEEDDHDLADDPGVRVHPVAGFRKELPRPVAEQEHEAHRQRQEEQRHEDERQPVQPRGAFVREARADRDRCEDVGREYAQQQQAEHEGECRGRRLQPAHPLRRLRFLPVEEDIDHQDDEDRENHDVDRDRRRAAVGGAVAGVHLLEHEVRGRKEGDDRNGRAENVG